MRVALAITKWVPWCRLQQVVKTSNIFARGATLFDFRHRRVENLRAPTDASLTASSNLLFLVKIRRTKTSYESTTLSVCHRIQRQFLATKPDLAKITTKTICIVCGQNASVFLLSSYYLR